MARRLLILSLFAVGLCAVVAGGQPPAEKKADPKAPAPDAAIEAALANDPDVRMARAKIQLAEAEWAKARQAVTQKVLTLRSLIADQKKVVGTAEESFALRNAAFQKGQGSRAEMLAAREKLEAAQSALARSETELKLITGEAGAAKAENTAQLLDKVLRVYDADTGNRQREEAFLKAMTASMAKTASGPIADRIRAALDKPIKLGEKGEMVPFEKALEAFKKVGLDVPVRVLVKVAAVSSLGEELPVGAWLQMYSDQTGDALLLVREYGLLVTGKTLAPPTDAASVFDLWKQKPAGEKK